MSRLRSNPARTFSRAASAALALACAAAWPAAALEGNADWSQFQGDPGHAGVLADGPVPPYRTAWTYRPEAGAGQQLTAPIVSGSVFVVEGPDGLYAADARTGQEVWSIARDGPPSMPAIAAVGKTAAVIFTDGRTAEDARVVAVSVTDGTPLWDRPPTLKAESRSGVSVDGDHAVVADENGNVYAIELNDGSTVWTAAVDRAPAGPLAIGGGSVFVVSGLTSSGGAASVDSLSAATGVENWSVAPDRTASFGSLAGVVDQTVIVAFPDGVVRGLSMADGSQDWSIRVNALVSPYSAPASDSGSTYVADTTGGLRRVSPGQGIEWLFQFNEGVLRSSPMVVGGSVLLGLGDGSIGAVNAETGHMIWRSSASGAPVTGLGGTGDTILAARSGVGAPEVIGLVHAPESSLTDVVSPTVPVPLDIVLGFGAAFVLIGGLILGGFRGLMLRRASIHDPSTQTDDDEIREDEDDL